MVIRPGHVDETHDAGFEHVVLAAGGPGCGERGGSVQDGHAGTTVSGMRAGQRRRRYHGTVCSWRPVAMAATAATAWSTSAGVL